MFLTKGEKVHLSQSKMICLKCLHCLIEVMQSEAYIVFFGNVLEKLENGSWTCLKSAWIWPWKRRMNPVSTRTLKKRDTHAQGKVYPPFLFHKWGFEHLFYDFAVIKEKCIVCAIHSFIHSNNSGNWKPLIPNHLSPWQLVLRHVLCQTSAQVVRQTSNSTRTCFKYENMSVLFLTKKTSIETFHFSQLQYINVVNILFLICGTVSLTAERSSVWMWNTCLSAWDLFMSLIGP